MGLIAEKDAYESVIYLDSLVQIFYKPSIDCHDPVYHLILNTMSVYMLQFI